MNTKLRFTDNPKYNVNYFSMTQQHGRIEGEFKMDMPKDVLFEQKIIDKLILIVGDHEWIMGNVFVSPSIYLEEYKEIVECRFSCTNFYVRKIEK